VRGMGLSQPKLATDDGASRVFELRRRAAMAFRRARQLVASLSFDAARRPLEDSVMLLACAYAAQRGLAEPRDVKQAIGDVFAELWGDTQPVLVQLLDSDGSPVSVVRALTTQFGTH